LFIVKSGVRAISSGSRTVFDDLVFVKSTIGQEKGQDINGNTTPGSEASGLTRKIEDVTKQTIKNTNELAVVSALVESSDLPKLIDDNTQFRKELGVAPDDDTTIYLRLSGLESKDTTNKETIESISESIGLGKCVVVDELDSLKTQALAIENELNTPDTGVKARVTTLEKVVLDPSTGLGVQVSDIKDEVTKVNDKIGDQGITKDVKNISDFVGYGTEPAPKTSLAGKLETLTALHNDTAATVQDIQVELGNANSGIKGDIKIINDKLAAQDVVIKDFDARLKLLEDRVAALEPA
jgi:uncharacterized coiled-coil protein SlyX